MTLPIVNALYVTIVSPLNDIAEYSVENTDPPNVALLSLNGTVEYLSNVTLHFC